MTTLHTSGTLGDKRASHPFSAARRRGHREGDHQQKADRDDEAERTQAIEKEYADVGARFGLHPPDRIEGALELEERAGRRDDEREAAENGGEYARPPLAGCLEKALHRARAFAADELIELAHDFPADGLGAEHHTRDGDGHEQDRRDRKQGVVGERRAEAQSHHRPTKP